MHDYGYSALHYACEAGMESLTADLLAHAAAAHASHGNGNGDHPLHRRTESAVGYLTDLRTSEIHLNRRPVQVPLIHSNLSSQRHLGEY